MIRDFILMCMSCNTIIICRRYLFLGLLWMVLCSCTTKSFPIVSLSQQSAFRRNKFIKLEKWDILCSFRKLHQRNFFAVEDNLLNFEKNASSSSSSSTTTTTTSLSRQNVIIAVTSHFPKYHTIAEEMSEKLGLKMIQLESLDELWTIDPMNDAENAKEDTHDLTHCLCLVPYTHSLSPSLDTYAIAILPLSNPDQNSKRKMNKKKKTKPSRKNNKNNNINPFYIDFCAPAESTIGRRFNNLGNELLLKAVTPKKVGNGVIYDLTAGFGLDSAIMAMGGASIVYMVERDPIVSTLLEDAMRRLHLVAELTVQQNDEISLRAKKLSETLKLIPGKEGADVAKILAQNEKETGVMLHDNTILPSADVCYLDPMFPPRTKSAAVKKNMQILHGLLNTNTIHDMNEEETREIDETNLLDAALSVARRVVVKRPLKAQLLSGEDSSIIKPSSQIKGSINRWDIYTPHRTCGEEII